MRHASMAVLTLNTGSSSLKAALYQVDQGERVVFSAEVSRIGSTASRLSIDDASGTSVLDEQVDVSDHAAALHAVLEWLQQQGKETQPGAIGHRVVHGGPRYREPVLVTEEMVDTLRQWIPIDPTHLPQAIAAIETVRQTFPAVPQVACFDTAFHRHMPQVAQMYALPRHFSDRGVMRYGFHGLSYESIMQALRTLDRSRAEGRMVIAHLGNGASMAAVRDGVGVDTTMGFTPAGGLMMGTRTGDLDPGVLLYLLESQHLTTAALETLITQQAGLLGVSGIGGDMRDLLDRESTDPHAAEAVELFCYQARKFLGALVAVLGGLETLIFTGGMGEHAAPVRQRICDGLQFLGVSLDPERNAGHAAIISAAHSAVQVRVMKTNEDLMIAQHTYRIVSQKG